MRHTPISYETLHIYIPVASMSMTQCDLVGVSCIPVPRLLQVTVYRDLSAIEPNIIINKWLSMGSVVCLNWFSPHGLGTCCFAQPNPTHLLPPPLTVIHTVDETTVHSR